MRKRLTRTEQVIRNRERVLLAARSVFLEKGYVGASLDAIADAAGFSKGVMYSQFGSKADLFLALLDQRIAERARENEHLLEETSGPEGLLSFLRAAERDAARESRWAELLIEFRIQAAREPEVKRRYAEAHARTIRGVASLLERMFAKAGATPALPPRTVAQLVLALGAGVVLERASEAGALPAEDLGPALLRAVGFHEAAERVPGPAISLRRAAGRRK